MSSGPGPGCDSGASGDGEGEEAADLEPLPDIDAEGMMPGDDEPGENSDAESENDESSSFAGDCGLDEGAVSAVDPAGKAGGGRKRLRRTYSWHTDGPTDLAGVIGVVPSHLDYMLREAASLGQKGVEEALLEFHNLDVVVTSCYSGTGCFEAVLGQVRSDLSTRFCTPAGTFTCYAATECSPAAHRMLTNDDKAERKTHHPLHLFADVLGRLHPLDLQKLKNIQSNALGPWKVAKDEYRQGKISKETLLEIRSREGTKMRNMMMEILTSVEFNKYDHCLVHNKPCPISPRDGGYPKAYWVEGTGNTCCPFSNMSVGKDCANAWLDKATLPFLVWAVSSRYFEPDSIIEENVVNFQHTELHSILAQTGEGVVKSMSTRPFLDEEQDGPFRHYTMQFQTFSPVDIGVPSDRCRKYTAFHLHPWVAEGFKISFEHLHFRRLCCGPEVYLNCINDATKQNELKAMVRTRRTCALYARSSIGNSSIDGNIKIEEVLTQGEYMHLEGAMLDAQAQGFLNDDGVWRPDVPVLLFNVQHRP